MKKGTLKREEKKSEWEKTQKMNKMKLSLQQRKMISPEEPRNSHAIYYYYYLDEL